MSNILFAIGASIVSKSIILLINIVSFRILSSQEYGIISLLLSITATIGAISGMGASVAINSLIARDGFTSLNIIFIKYNYIISSFLSVILAVLICLFYIKNVDGISWLLAFCFIIFFSLFSSLNSISEAVLLGLKNFKRIFINNLVIVLLLLPISLYLILDLKILGVILSLVIYRFLLFLINICYSSTCSGVYLPVKVNYSHSLFKKNNINTNKIYKIFREFSFPVILSNLLVAPVIALAFKIVSIQDNGLNQLAYFNIIYQIYLVAIFVPNALTGYFISRFSSGNQNKENKKDFLKIAKNNFLFSLVVVLCMFLFQELLFSIIGNSSKDVTGNYYIMLGTIILFSLNTIFSSYWPSTGRVWLGFHMNIIWAIVFIIVILVFSKYQISFMLAWAFFIAYLILSIIQILSYQVLNYEKK